jgi:hypothetical protein
MEMALSIRALDAYIPVPPKTGNARMGLLQQQLKAVEPRDATSTHSEPNPD